MKKAAHHAGVPRSQRSKKLLEDQLKKEQALGIKRDGKRVSDSEKYSVEEAKVEEVPTDEVEDTQADIVDDDLPEESSHEDE